MVAAKYTFVKGHKWLTHVMHNTAGDGLYCSDIDCVYRSSVALDVDTDANNVGRPPPSLRGASTSFDQPESRMSQLEMEYKITLLTSEVDGLKKTIFEMRSHFDMKFSKLRAIVDKQLRNGSTLDPWPHLNQVAANVNNWDPCPQRKQGDSGMYMSSYAEYYATMPHFLQGELDIGAHRSRLAFLFYSFGMTKNIYRYESESDNIAKAPTTKVPSTKAYDRKRKARDVKK
ncbi:hypothetical protein POM88_001247 [Heracleum sosnowskyi]|uniref:Uncharacterized protein n=1 Tax=Heracleum sosnowskyi TaxID=360622 RepID=A0AAD8NA59_9APIA|nr:hypothetical protein POM88_001247 [Heracleum sosnowskyi]